MALISTNAPSSIVWIIATVLGLLAIISHFVAIPVVSGYAFYILTLGFILLVLSTLLKGM